jgi:hypothetical protein
LYGPSVAVQEMVAGAHCVAKLGPSVLLRNPKRTHLGESRGVDAKVSRERALGGGGDKEESGKDSGVHG